MNITGLDFRRRRLEMCVLKGQSQQVQGSADLIVIY